ncbi:MAG TPA: DUF4169 family protein [Beijerinckiaceae bacterium]|jgi:phage protein D
MAEIINLNRARKAKARAEKDAKAEANRARHGRTKAERTQAEAADDRVQRQLDHHKLNRDEDA